MDRIQFLHSINCNGVVELTDVIVGFFDQYMLLYNLVDNVNNVKILNSNDNLITFELNYIDNTSVYRLSKVLVNGGVIALYEKYFKVSFNILDDSSITISILKMNQ